MLIDINEVIREMVVLLHNETGKYAISIHTTLAQDISHVMGDGVQLQQVLMNLIVNITASRRSRTWRTERARLLSSLCKRTSSNLWCRSVIPASGYPRDHTRSSMRSLPPSCTGPAWDIGLTAPSSNLMGAAYGRLTTCLEAQASS